MRIQHNIMAMNSYRNFNTNSAALSKNLEKLSSGYRINRAGDDAAGLAISEKMRAQITGLDAAQKNVKDGISMVKTAEGAMQEIQDMMSRMKYLATQSSNGTYQDEVDRENLQKEVDALKTEINRIADSANFNGQSLLDGSLSVKGGSSSVATVVTDNLELTNTTAAKGKYTDSAAMSSTIAKTEKVGSSVSYTVSYSEGGAEKSVTITATLSKNEDGDYVLVGDSGKEYTIADFVGAGATAAEVDTAIAAELKLNKELSGKFNITAASGAAFAFEAKEEGSAGAVITAFGESATVNTGVTTTKAHSVTQTTQAKDVYQQAAAGNFTQYKKDGTVKKEDAIFTVNGKKFAYVEAGADISQFSKDVNVVYGTADAAGVAQMADLISLKTGLKVEPDTTANTTLNFKPGVGVTGSGGMVLQIGDTAETYNQLKVNINDMHTRALGIDGLDISTRDGASIAIQDITDAINKVSQTRGDLGAIQNRLEHTANNLSVMEENITDAESTIRDTDMADEMTTYTKNNILMQAAQAMLAQANQQPQGVLQLLQ